MQAIYYCNRTVVINSNKPFPVENKYAVYNFIQLAVRNIARHMRIIFIFTFFWPAKWFKVLPVLLQSVLPSSSTIMNVFSGYTINLRIQQFFEIYRWAGRLLQLKADMRIASRTLHITQELEYGYVTIKFTHWLTTRSWIISLCSTC